MPDEPILDLTIGDERESGDLRDPKVRAGITATVQQRLNEFAEREKAAREQVVLKRLMQPPARDYGLSAVGHAAQMKREAEARAVAAAVVPPLLTVLQEQRDDMRSLVGATTQMVGIVEQQARELCVEREARDLAEKTERRDRALILGLTVASVVLTLALVALTAVLLLK